MQNIPSFHAFFASLPDDFEEKLSAELKTIVAKTPEGKFGAILNIAIPYWLQQYHSWLSNALLCSRDPEDQ